MVVVDNILDFLKSNLDYISILCGLTALIAISERLRAILYFIASKFKTNPQIITGYWLLFIYDSDDKVYKIDQYRIKQYRQEIFGKIKRIYSAEDKTQEKTREYVFKGYFYKDEIYYAFKPITLQHSYGVCILEAKKDLEYMGKYYVPFHKRRGNDKRKSVYKIKLTKNLQEIVNNESIDLTKINKRILRLPQNNME